MSELTFHSVSPSFVVKVENETREPLPHFVLKRIDEIWEHEKAILGSVLFNGSLLSAVRFNEHELIGRIVEYKYYMAQMRDPSLKEYLELLPLGVSARTFAGNSVLMGRRSDKVFLDRGMLECVPSGGVDLHACREDRVDMRRQIEIELHEETGLPVSYIQNYSVLGFVVSEGICEICVELILDESLKETDLAINDEYSEFMWIPQEEIAGFVKQRAAEIIPVSQWLLKRI